MDHDAVRTHGLRKAYGEQVVLDGVDLTVPRGTVYALLGPNGAGKTTLVRILATLTPPDAGRATVAGHDVVADPGGVRGAISLTGQYAAVDELLTGAENLRMMARFAGLDRRGAAARAGELLAAFDLVDAADRRVSTYSGGMRRRLDLAASLVRDPEVLVLDEPTTGLDTRSRQALWAQIAGLRARGTTILLTTQYLEEADRLADRIGLIDGGVIAAEGSAAELKSRVGATLAELTVASDRELDAAAAALGPRLVDLDPAARLVRATTDGGGSDVHALLGDLAGSGVEVVHVGLHRPSLDDVFLALTDRARPAAAADDGGDGIRHDPPSALATTRRSTDR
jgi:ABC-2 type transport system ATP-binding protein